MKLRLLALAIALAAALPSVRANSFVEVIGGSAAGTTGAGTQVAGAGLDYVVGRMRLALDPSQRAFITYTYEGGESIGRTQFFGPSGASMIDNLAARGTLITTRIEAGLLDFAFDAAGAAGVANRGNAAWNPAHVGVVLGADRLSGWLLFEDGRNTRGADFDHDDMVMRFAINVSPVPEPATTALMLAGLGALGLARRRVRTLQAPLATVHPARLDVA